MKQEPLNITNFEIGDIIVRMQPAIPLGTDMGQRGDRSYMGKPLKFLGMANGCIYAEKVKSKNSEADKSLPDMFDISEMISLFTGEAGSKLLSLPIDLWSEGWAKYIDPYSIAGDYIKKETNGLKIEELQKLYKIALDDENYEKAEKLKKIIDAK